MHRTAPTTLATRRRLITVIMPARNEERNLPRAYDEVTSVMSRVAYDYEVLIIDNDSSDGTATAAAQLCHRDQRWRFVKFSRNFNVEASISAGLRLARGDAAVVLFSDLQDPPELMTTFFEHWEAGNEVVYGVLRDRQGDPWWKALGAKLVYRAVHALSDVEITPNATDFRLLSRRAIDALNQFDERNRYLRGFAHWIGFRSCGVEYDRRPRTSGKSKAPFFYLIGLAINAVTCFSTRPLQLFSLAGAAALGATVLLATVYLGSYFFSYTMPGLTTVYLLLLANLAVLLLGFGTLGEYVGRTYVETKRRPLWIIDYTLNFETNELSQAGMRSAISMHADSVPRNVA